MLISKSYFKEEDGRLSCLTPFTLSGKPEVLRVSVRTEDREILSDRSDGPLAALLMLAMLRGESIEVAGPLSPRLFSELSSSTQAIIRCNLPELHTVKISACDLKPNLNQGTGVATAFSGGVDAFYTLKKFFYDSTTPDMRITRLTLANVGAYFAGGLDLHLQHHAKLLPLTQKWGLPFCSIDTNLPELYKGNIHFLRYYPVANAAMALFVQNNLQYYYISSGQTYVDQSTQVSSEIDSVETMLIPTFSTESIKLIMVGSAARRTEKTATIIEEAGLLDCLNVCVIQHVGNCSKCYKCLRTLLTMEILGVLNQCDRSFDLEIYRKQRVGHLHQLYKEYGNYMMHDLRAFAQARRFKLPLAVRLMAPLWILKYYQWKFKKHLRTFLSRRQRRLA